MVSTTYTNKTISDAEPVLGTEECGFSFLPKNATTPVVAGYRPEIDPTPELDQRKQNYYQGLIGVICWICELGRLDNLMPVSLFSRYLAQAWEGHLNQEFHIFAYFKRYGKSKIVFDDSLPEIDDSRFHTCDLEEFEMPRKHCLLTCLNLEENKFNSPASWMQTIRGVKRLKSPTLVCLFL